MRYTLSLLFLVSCGSAQNPCDTYAAGVCLRYDGWVPGHTGSPELVERAAALLAMEVPGFTVDRADALVLRWQAMAVAGEYAPELRELTVEPWPWERCANFLPTVQHELLHYWQFKIGDGADSMQHKPDNVWLLADPDSVQSRVDARDVDAPCGS
jgi:hypothetical protein